jgi:hypothetical protein
LRDRYRFQFPTKLALLTGFVFAAGCGSSGVELHPVEGQVLYEGQPAAGVQIVFHPTGEVKENASLMPSGKTGDDGSFTLQTHPHGAGAPAGEYAVLATWYPANGRELDNPRNKLSSKYADSATPLLKARIKPGPNKLEPFQVSK